MINDERMTTMVDSRSGLGKKGQNRGYVVAQGLTVKEKAFEEKRVKEMKD